MTTVYFAAPIDQADPAWRSELAELTRRADELPGIIGFHPARAFSVGPFSPSTHVGLEKVNRAAMAACDAVVAFVPARVPSVGVPREIEAAVSAGKPVVVCTDVRSSFSLADVQQFELTPDGLEKAVYAVVGTVAQRQGYPSDEVLFSIGPTGMLPARSRPHDAGLDLYVSERVVIPSGQFRDVPLDVRMAMPPGIWGRVVGRSSTLRNRGLMVVEGVIDPGYRGDLYSGVFNLGPNQAVVERGERISQLIPHHNLAPVTWVRGVTPEEFDAVPHDGRGENGFGSSGA